jgi:hypothetical protein
MDGGHMQGTQRHGPDRKYNLPDPIVIIGPAKVFDMIWVSEQDAGCPGRDSPKP